MQGTLLHLALLYSLNSGFCATKPNPRLLNLVRPDVSLVHGAQRMPGGGKGAAEYTESVGGENRTFLTQVMILFGQT